MGESAIGRGGRCAAGAILGAAGTDAAAVRAARALLELPRRDSEAEGLYAAAACDDERSALMVAYFNDDDEDTSTRTVALSLIGGAGQYECYLLDETSDAAHIGTVGADGVLTLRPNTVCLLCSHA